MNYKPFNLEAAKRGEPVITREGAQVRILCTDAMDEDYPIICLVRRRNQEITKIYTIDGFYTSNKVECCNDLVMAPIIREYWANVYKSSRGELYVGANQYPSKEAAEEQAEDRYVNTVLLYKGEVDL